MAKEKAKKEIEAEEVVEEATAEVEVDEKELLKEAEEREKERKQREEEEKVEAKAQKAAEKEAEKEEKEEKKATQQRRKPRHGKKYRELAKKIEAKDYSVEEAIKLALETSPAKFDATVELHVKISTKEKNPIRGLVVLPGGVAKEKKIKEVTEANIDDAIAEIKAGKIDFDLLIADIKVMPKLAQLAKVLGPKGLMPSPKAGTAVEDVKKAAEELKGGKVEYRADKTNIVHIALGKVSFGDERIRKNYDAVIAVMPARRIDSIFLTTSMGPSIKVAK